MRILKGRASRSQYGRVFTALIVVAIMFAVLAEHLPEPLVVIFVITYAIVGNGYNITYGVRRLHDIGKSGWWFITILIPIVNAVLIVALLSRPGTEGANQFDEP